ncbi:MAG: DUF1552 domain-containing protein [Deltaproteobacteria bacterium]|nr:DUF1552 domain-containing protein [Deltaproteobacteria bacterium]
MKISRARRSFLRGVGTGFAALPFFKLLEDSHAKAVGEILPLRFVTLYHPHGIAHEYWGMQPGDTETAFNLSFANSSLKAFDTPELKSKLLVVEGIDLLSNANGHDSAGTILTGSRIDASGQKPLNASLDQVLAVDNKLGASTPVTSIALGVGTADTKSGSTLSFGPGGAALPKIIDPVQAFNTLFANFIVPSDSAGAAAAMRQRVLGQSIIDFVRGDINRLKPRLAAAEKDKLDQHLTSLRDLEKQITPMMNATACTPPTKPDASKFPKLQQYNGGEPYFDAITDAHITLIAQAFACDVTRFATLYMADLSYAGNPLGLPTDNHGSVAHTYNGSSAGSDGRPTGAGNPATWDLLAKFNGYSYSKVALLMQKLAAMGVLENTLIYASSDMGNPALHSTRNVPTVLAGGVNGKFRMGRRVKLIADCPASNLWCSPSDATFKASTNNHLLVSIAQAFGVNLNTFGSQPTAELTTGPLAGLT